MPRTRSRTLHRVLREAVAASASARIATRRARKAHTAIEELLQPRPLAAPPFHFSVPIIRGATRVGLIDGKRQVYSVIGGRRS